MQDFSKDALLEFLDFMANKGLLNRGTALSRKAAVNTLLSILSPDEAADVRKIDVEELVRRFSNLKGSEFKPESLKVYRSRLNSVLDDFVRYRNDPLGFKPKITQRDKVERQDRIAAPKITQTIAGDPKARRQEPSRVEHQDEDHIESIVFPIPIRPGVIVKVAGIPSDLTLDEAHKIGNVILALSGSQE